MTKACEDSLTLMLTLARHGGQMYARDASREAGVPEMMGAKLLQDLARRGLLQSGRGHSGGFALAGNPTVADIIRAVDPRALLVPFAGPAGKLLANWRGRMTIGRLAKKVA